jgi:L-threonylcarbamoyladenylate synthase
VGIESTLIDCTRGQPVLLRPGSISPADIQAACGVQVLNAHQAAALGPLTQPAPRASGTLASHYAPAARVHLLNWDQLQAAVLQATAHAQNHDRTHIKSHPVAVYSRTPWQEADVVWRPMPHAPQAAAHELFAVLRELDALGVSDIFVQAPPADTEWDGVRDRLTRASA